MHGNTLLHLVVKMIEMYVLNTGKVHVPTVFPFGCREFFNKIKKMNEKKLTENFQQVSVFDFQSLAISSSISKSKFYLVQDGIFKKKKKKTSV